MVLVVDGGANKKRAPKGAKVLTPLTELGTWQKGREGEREQYDLNGSTSH